MDGTLSFRGENEGAVLKRLDPGFSAGAGSHGVAHANDSLLVSRLPPPVWRPVPGIRLRDT